MEQQHPALKIFKDYEILSFGKGAALFPFRREIGNLEQCGYKIGRLANLFSLFFRPTESDPEGAKLLQKMDQIPMVEIIGSDNDEISRTVVLLRNKDEKKAFVSITI